MSRVSFIRSAARVTSFAPSRWPIRWRLAGASALLTLVILCAFAGAVGVLTTQRLHKDFNSQVAATADKLEARMEVAINSNFEYEYRRPYLQYYAAGTNAGIRVLAPNGQIIKSYPGEVDLGPPIAETVEVNGYRVENRTIAVKDSPTFGVPPRVVMQYGRPLADVDATVNRVKVFLLIGVLSGAGLALLAGLMIARRAMAPIAALTATAREIERTRDSAMRVPEPAADDEVAELARTLDGMLGALDESRSQTEAALRRQRQFVADASHELRTPLTAVLANLELLADTLDGERGEAAQSALRSSRRMRRLVADLLLLARADAERHAPHEPTDVGEVLVDAAAEVGAVAQGHELSVQPSVAVVDGDRDELHRVALNLMENAIKHTPEGTHVRATVRQSGGDVELIVEDDGPGIPEDLRERVFERFVRGAGDRGGSFGLGLSIVRAVAESHGGRVRVESPINIGENGDGADHLWAGNGSSTPHGTRFVVTLPAAKPAPAAEPVGTAG